MSSVQIVAARSGCKKVSHTRLLQTAVGLSLAEAKRVTDAVLEGRCPEVNLSEADAAHRLVREMDAIGFTARVLD